MVGSRAIRDRIRLLFPGDVYHSGCQKSSRAGERECPKTLVQEDGNREISRL